MPNTIEYMKEFSAWMILKADIDQGQHQAPLVSEGDLWWVHMGANVGTEIDGKSKYFSRPAIIYKKLASDFFFIIPVTTAKHEGSWYVPYSHKGIDAIACLHQARAIDHRRLSSKIGMLDGGDFARVITGFRALFYM